LPDGQKIYPVLDPMQADYGAGYRLDYPVSNGNCAYCHVPAGSPGTLQEMNVAGLINGSLGSHVNAVTEGITCDVCHKVTDVLVDKNTRLPYDDRPGILSMSIVRPISNQQFVYGPLGYQTIADMSAKRTCFPIFSESKFCAACHYGKFANTPIYGSYKEWLDTPYYSNRANSTYRSCQDCHMIGQEKIGNTLPSERDACSDANVNYSDFNHNMMRYGPDPENGSREIPTLVQGAAKITLEATLSAGQIHVKATVVNTGAGHKFPTDSPLRHLLLWLEARDWRGNLLTQTGGPMVPVWAAPDYGGYPGQIYANILKDKDTNLAPSFAYWNPVEPAWGSSDTRLPPLVAVPSIYSFTAPYDRSATITARLIYRREFLNVVNKKGWPLVDLDVEVDQAVLECSGFGPDPQTMVCQKPTEQ
jgi:nitrate/TMAO reductase-like tetraheme cytochrome c subunit